MWKRTLWFTSPLFLIAGLAWAAGINTSARCSSGTSCEIGGGVATSFQIDTDGTGGLDEFTAPDITFEAFGDAILNTAAGTYDFTKDESGTVVITASDDGDDAALTVQSGGTGALTVTPGGAGPMQIGSAGTTTLGIDNNGAMTIGDATTTDSMDLATAGAMTIGGATTTDSITLATAGAIVIGGAAADSFLIDATGAGTLGSANLTSLTITTDDTGDGTDLVLPADSVGSAEIGDEVCHTVVAGFLDPTETQATDDALNLVDNTITSNATPATAINAEDEYTVPLAMVAHSLKVSDVTDPGTAGDIWQITLYDDGVATALTCDVVNGGTSCSDVANTPTIAADSDLVIFVDSSTGGSDPAASGNMRVSFCLSHD